MKPWREWAGRISASQAVQASKATHVKRSASAGALVSAGCRLSHVGAIGPGSILHFVLCAQGPQCLTCRSVLPNTPATLHLGRPSQKAVS